MKDIQKIKECFLFSRLDNDALLAVGQYIDVKEYRKGSVIFSEGEPATALYILAKGMVVLIKGTPDGREQLIRTVKPYEQFAEAAVFSGTDYPATAIVKKDSVLFSLRKEKIIKLIGDYPEAALGMMSTMSDLLRHLNKLVSDLKLKSVDIRLADYLFEKYNMTGSKRFSIGCKKQDLAFQLGTTKETLSRMLKKLTKAGIIKVEKNYIDIRDISKLRAILKTI